MRAIKALILLLALVLIGAYVYINIQPQAILIVKEDKTATLTGGSYAFTNTLENGQPVRYDSCQPIQYVTNYQNAPEGAVELTENAIKEVSNLTGLTFENLGPSDEPALMERPSFQEQYGQRWAPILIIWTDETHLAALSGEAVGQGGSVMIEEKNNALYVTGAVQLDGPDLGQIITEGRPDYVQAVIEHELGHLVGLDHINDPTQLMNPIIADNVTTFSESEKEALKILGQGPCFEPIDPVKFAN